MDHDQIVTESKKAMRLLLAEYWKEIKPYAEFELRKFTMTTEHLAKLKIAGEIVDDELKKQIIIKRTNLYNVLLNKKGITLSMAQSVVNEVATIVAKELVRSLNVVLPI